MKPTAVEFAVEQLEQLIPSGHQLAIRAILEQALEMEKKDICHFGAKCCFMTTQKKSWTIEELYNEQFKNK
jgi:hypothetical protein